jgi:hypothetical protein
MLQRALVDAQAMLDGPAIQARCLECPSVAPARLARTSDTLLSRLLALVWRG